MKKKAPTDFEVWIEVYPRDKRSVRASVVYAVKRVIKEGDAEVIAVTESLPEAKEARDRCVEDTFWLLRSEDAPQIVSKIVSEGDDVRLYGSAPWVRAG